MDVLMDYGINSFPLDMDELCRKMNINIVPYSGYDPNVELLLKKRFNNEADTLSEDEITQYFDDIEGGFHVRKKEDITGE